MELCYIAMWIACFCSAVLKSCFLLFCFVFVLTPWSRGLPAKLTRPQLVTGNSPHFMEPEGSLPHSQEPPTCPCSEPNRSSPCPPPAFRRSILILFFHLRLVLKVASFPQDPPKPRMHLASPPFMLLALPISVFLL
jgi:hypothetical protein